jgi:hypothetical protein
MTADAGARGGLMALSPHPPETRSTRVRVVQGLGDQDTPPEPAPRVRGGASVIIVAPIWVGGTPRRHSHGAPVQHSHGGGGFKGGGSNLAASAMSHNPKTQRLKSSQNGRRPT